ncbi:MAG: vitamin B12-dependent ribonucleotide reductase [Candidatus Binatia bacterium]
MEERVGAAKGGEPGGAARPGASGPGLSFGRRLSTKGVDPYSTVEWELRDAVILGEGGRLVFEQKGVEFPVSWSPLATNVVSSKYFRGRLGTESRESSVRQLIGRVVTTVVGWGEAQRYFASDEDRDAFGDELTQLLLQQQACFNSPVWFNVGVEERPQCSACFILSVDDTMDSILAWYRNEGVIFKGGSGSGVNLSRIRSSKEPLSGGGTASGPVSFMKAADASAGVIKSGGKTRRAAKMVVLDVDHPDITEFVSCKANEERKAWTLIDAGYDGSIDGDAYGSVFFQNANNSVRVSDGFMQAVVEDGEWHTRNVRDGRVNQTMRARDLMRQISEAAHLCGDPGIQFDTTINDWHTCPNSGRINASNPCSEYMHLDNSACNLASLNLMKFVNGEGKFDVEGFRHAVDIILTAQDILVDNSSYPTPEIGRTARSYRQLGLGYANLGALLMRLGVPYDSEEGRAYAAAVTSLMCGEAYLQSARIAGAKEPYEGYAKNSKPQLRVIAKHREKARDIESAYVPLDVLSASRDVWDEALELGTTAGVRNSQVTVLAPTGTIAFMMDCDTTGIEPDLALVKFKKLVGGGVLKFVNGTVGAALERLGYESREIQEILEYVDTEETIEGAPHLQEKHLPVFDCAFRPRKGVRSITPMGHIRMMGAVQPFISGAISKTINMPNDATVEEIEEAYIDAWRLGLKAIAIYRDGCKRIQPMTTGSVQQEGEAAGQTAEKPQPVRRRLPVDCTSLRHKFEVAGHEGYIHVGFYDDGTPGEIFIKMAKEGSTISGLMDTIATLTSMSLQYGVPLEALVSKFSHVRFEPSGFTKNPAIPMAKSLTDYIFRFLGSRFSSVAPGSAPPDAGETLGEPGQANTTSSGAKLRVVAGGLGRAAGEQRAENLPTIETAVDFILPQTDAPSCTDCGSIMVRNGACYKCLNCGLTSGCS